MACFWYVSLLCQTQKSGLGYKFGLKRGAVATNTVCVVKRAAVIGSMLTGIPNLFLCNKKKGRARFSPLFRFANLVSEFVSCAVVYHAALFQHIACVDCLSFLEGIAALLVLHCAGIEFRNYYYYRGCHLIFQCFDSRIPFSLLDIDSTVSWLYESRRQYLGTYWLYVTLWLLLDTVVLCSVDSLKRLVHETFLYP